MRDRDVDIYLKTLNRKAKATAVRKLAAVCGTTMDRVDGYLLEEIEFETLEFACFDRTITLRTNWPLATSAEEMYGAMIVQLRLAGFPVSDDI